MGWFSYDKSGNFLHEEEHGRPVQAGEEGSLAIIGQEDFGHKVAIDLSHGIVFIDYETIGVQNGSIEVTGVKIPLYICEDTNIGMDMFHLTKTEPDKDGWYSDIVKPLVWRPIWFTRVTNGVPTKVIGAQTTLSPEFGGKNVKAQIMLFADGRVGLYIT